MTFTTAHMHSRSRSVPCPRWLRSAMTIVLAIVMSGVAFLLPAGSASAQDAGVGDAQVNVVDFAFEPSSVTIPAGATVTWTNTGSRPHTVTADDGSFDSGNLAPGESFTHTFTEAGSISYHCNYHPNMVATVVVN